jgi:uncharacterized protein involved in exopolysaccharide biosynthesis
MTTKDVRKLLGDEAEALSDEQLEALQGQLSSIAAILIQEYERFSEAIKGLNPLELNPDGFEAEDFDDEGWSE